MAILVSWDFASSSARLLRYLNKRMYALKCCGLYPIVVNNIKEHNQKQFSELSVTEFCMTCRTVISKYFDVSSNYLQSVWRLFLSLAVNTCRSIIFCTEVIRNLQCKQKNIIINIYGWSFLQYIPVYPTASLRNSDFMFHVCCWLSWEAFQAKLVREMLLRSAWGERLEQ